MGSAKDTMEWAAEPPERKTKKERKSSTKVSGGEEREGARFSQNLKTPKAMKHVRFARQRPNVLEFRVERLPGMAR